MFNGQFRDGQIIMMCEKEKNNTQKYKNRLLIYHLNCDAKYKRDMLHLCVFFSQSSQGYPLDGKITSTTQQQTITTGLVERKSREKIVKY